MKSDSVKLYIRIMAILLLLFTVWYLVNVRTLAETADGSAVGYPVLMSGVGVVSALGTLAAKAIAAIKKKSFENICFVVPLAYIIVSALLLLLGYWWAYRLF